MKSIDGRVAKLETASSAKSQAWVLQVGDQTEDEAIAAWMAKNPGKKDPRRFAEMTIMHVVFV